SFLNQIRIARAVSIVANGTDEMSRTLGRTLAGLLSVAPLLSCSLLPRTPRKDLLQPVRMHADSAALDVLFVPLPQGENLEQRLWRDADEQFLSAELRERLVKNGFRVGIVGGRVPRILEDRLAVDRELVVTEAGQQADLHSEDRISGRHLQLRTGKRAEIQVSRPREEVPVLFPQGKGRTYRQAQGILLVKAFPQSDGSVKLELTPEIQHGALTGRYRATQEGVWMVQPSRDRETFTDLKVAANLTAGQLLVISCDPRRGGSLGGRFFQDVAEGKPEQKILILRLAQTRSDSLGADLP
ncbi:MAG: hypothetical protein N2C14_29280, partial [Planctomycetales bacterium]